jgi:branched-chain amino acid transport system permease protein
MYYFVLILVLGGTCLLHRAKHSPFGEILHAIRENETRTISLGYHPNGYKLLGFVLSAAVSGLAGGLNTLVSHLATLSDVDWTTSGEAVLMVLLGGVGTTFGPFVGAVVIVTMQNYLAELQSRLTILEGIIFVVCVVAFRHGIVGESNRLSRALWVMFLPHDTHGSLRLRLFSAIARKHPRDRN